MPFVGDASELATAALLFGFAVSGCSSRQSTESTPTAAREPPGSGSLTTPEALEVSGGSTTITVASPIDAGADSALLTATSPDGSRPVARWQTPLERERAAFALAIPVFRRHCGACHLRESGRRAALHHFDITVDPFGGHHRHEITLVLRRVLGEVQGREATMPPRAPGSVQGEELALIRQWLSARDAVERQVQ